MAVLIKPAPAKTGVSIHKCKTRCRNASTGLSAIRGRSHQVRFAKPVCNHKAGAALQQQQQDTTCCTPSSPLQAGQKHPHQGTSDICMRQVGQESMHPHGSMAAT